MNFVLLVLALAPTSLTADEAVALALEHNPALKAAETHRIEVQERGAAATALENPQFRIQNLRSDRLLQPAFSGQQYSPHPLANAQLALRWNIPNPFEFSALGAQTGHELAAVSATVETEKRELMARVRSLHATALGLDRQIELARLSVAFRRQLREYARQRVEARAARGLDESLGELDVFEAEEHLLELERRHRESLIELSKTLGLSANTSLELTGAPVACRVPAEPGKEHELVERAVTASPDLQRARERQAAIEFKQRSRRLAALPWFDYVQLGYVFGGDDAPAWGVLSLGVNLPVANWHGHEVAMLQAEHSRIALQAEATHRAIESDVSRLLVEVREDSTIVERYQTAEPQTIDRSLDALQKSVAAGQSSLVEATLVQARILSARRAALRTELHCQLALIDLQRLGVEP